VLKKRGKTWHCHFVVNGQRIRQSLETTDWRDAQAKEKELIAQVQNGKLHQASISHARKPFSQAADEYVITRNTQPSRKTRKKLAAASLDKEKYLLVPLRLYFREEPLRSITADRIRQYLLWRESRQEVRAGKEIRFLSGVGPATLNAELGVLRRILKAAKLWARIGDEIQPQKEPESIGRALTREEQQRLLKTAAAKPEWETAYLAAVLALNTTKRAGDLKGLRWEDVDLFGKTMTIQRKQKRGQSANDPFNRGCLFRFRPPARAGRVLRAHRAFPLRVRVLRRETGI
jgi:integrase